MLKDSEPIATVAVHDLAVARKFYEGTLGLNLVDENADVLTFKAGQFTLFVYKSQFAGTNQATAVTWMVGDEVDGIVRDLKSRGVGFEHYDMPELRLDGDLHVMGDMKV